MVRKAAERSVLTLPREHVCADIVGAPSLEILDDRQPDGTDGFTLLTVVAVPPPPVTIALPRGFLVLTETRVSPAMMSLRTLLMSVLVRSLTRLVGGDR